MAFSRLAALGFVLAAGLGLSACVSDGYYGGISTGYSTGYYDSYYDPYGAGSYYGWYGDYYYPGTGIYVYDRYRRPHRWTSSQQRYWEGRRVRYQRDHRGWTGNNKANWNGWHRPGANDRRGPDRRVTPRANNPRENRVTRPRPPARTDRGATAPRARATTPRARTTTPRYQAPRNGTTRSAPSPRGRDGKHRGNRR